MKLKKIGLATTLIAIVALAGCNEAPSDTKTSISKNDIDEHDHSFGDVQYEIDNAQCCAKRVCTYCDYMEYEYADGVYVLDTPAYCNRVDSGHYVFNFNNPIFETQSSEAGSATTWTFDADNHKYDISYEWTNGTCKATAVCEICTLSTTEYEVGEFIEDTPATLDSLAKGHFEVAFENPLFESQITVKNGELDLPKLETPVLTMASDGTVTWETQDYRDYYECRFDGRNDLIQIVNESFYLPGRYNSMSIRACCNCGKHRNSDFSNTVSFDEDEYDSQYNSFSLTADSITITSQEGDYSTFTIPSSDGRTLHFTAYKLSIHNNQLLLGADGYVYSTDLIGGLYKTEVEYDSDSASAKANVELAYCFKDNVDSIDDFVFYYYPILKLNAGTYSMEYQDYLVITGSSTSEVEISSMKIHYYGGHAEYKCSLSGGFYGYVTTGELYHESRETQCVGVNNEYKRYFICYSMVNSICSDVESLEMNYIDNFEDVLLYNNNDEEISKSSRIQKGYYTTCRVDDTVLKVDFPFAENGKKGYIAPTTGEIHAIVIPYVFSDQLDRRSIAIEEIQKAFGRIQDGYGNVTNYNVEDSYISLTEYYDIASYGNITIDAFITDFYYDDRAYKNLVGSDLAAEIQSAMEEWFPKQHSSLDLSQFDSNNDGKLDAVIVLNLGDLTGYDGYTMTGIDGTFVSENRNHSTSMCRYMNINLGSLHSNHHITDPYDAKVLIHEFGHMLNLDDYYDNNYTIAPIGDYDMQSSNGGDWNAFSKYLAGWINPMEFTKNLFDEDGKYTTTISSFSKTGDAIIIRVDDSTGVYGEYLIIDLFDGSSGLNAYDSESFGLDKTVGVRIEHVNYQFAATSDYLFYKSRPEINYTDCRERIYQKLYSNDYNIERIYELSFIQAGKNNTFQREGERHQVIDSDYFHAGDIFDQKEYAAFFEEDGAFYNGTYLDFTITVDSIEYDEATGNYTATLTFEKNK